MSYGARKGQSFADYLYGDELREAEASLQDAKTRLKEAEKAFERAYGKQLDELVAFARKQGAPWPNTWDAAMQDRGESARDYAAILYMTQPEHVAQTTAHMDVERYTKEVRRLKRKVKETKKNLG